MAEKRLYEIDQLSKLTWNDYHYPGGSFLYEKPTLLRVISPKQFFSASNVPVWERFRNTHSWDSKGQIYRQESGLDTETNLVWVYKPTKHWTVHLLVKIVWFCFGTKIFIPSDPIFSTQQSSKESKTVIWKVKMKITLSQSLVYLVNFSNQLDHFGQ